MRPADTRKQLLIGTKLITDLLILMLLPPFAFWLRVEDDWTRFLAVLPVYLLVSLLVKAIFYFGLRLNRHSWNRVGIWDLFDIARMVLLSTIVLSGFSLLTRSALPEVVPRSVPFIDGLLTLLALGGVRFFARFGSLWIASTRDGEEGQRMLIVGAGESGSNIAREMARHPDMGMLPVGFVDDDPMKRAQSFVNLPVLGTIADVPQVVQDYGIEEVVIAMPSAPGSLVRQVVQLAREAGARYRIIPGYYEILSGDVSISQIKEVEVEDLLRRAPVQLDVASISGYLTGKTILVTGAGGSIGSELVRQIARFEPGHLLLFGRGENSIYQIQQELRRTWPDLHHTAIIGDIQRRAKLEHVFQTYQPEVVFHAAAHKHVPLMEANPEEAVLNNVVGSRNLVELALQYGVERFVNISTDKAVNPTSIMGASKRVIEYLVTRAGEHAAEGQVFASVRFGNVLGSRGSVVPLFKDLIRRRQPVTVTHPEMTRYFMTIPEAAQLVLQAGGLGTNGAVFVLDMGEPVKIVDLAYDLIRLSGLEPHEDIEVIFTGIRPGEKLFEELTTQGEQATKYEKIFIVRDSDIPEVDLEAHLTRLVEAARCTDHDAIRRTFKALVPTYAFTPGKGG